MIRINLLVTERKVQAKKAGLQASQKIVIGCSALLLGTGAYVGWRFLALRQGSAQLDADISAAQKETARLHSIIEQVQQFEQRRTQLQQRVSLIEELRRDQIGPVHMLDQISRALPSMLWLTDMKQTPGTADVTIAGRATTMTGLSDFVANLEASGYFKRSIEIVSSTTEPMAAPPGELIKFEIKASFQTPATVKPAAPAAPAELKPRS